MQLFSTEANPSPQFFLIFAGGKRTKPIYDNPEPLYYNSSTNQPELDYNERESEPIDNEYELEYHLLEPEYDEIFQSVHSEPIHDNSEPLYYNPFNDQPKLDYNEHESEPIESKPEPENSEMVCQS